MKMWIQFCCILLVVLLAVYSFIIDLSNIWKTFFYFWTVKFYQFCLQRDIKSKQKLGFCSWTEQVFTKASMHHASFCIYGFQTDAKSVMTCVIIRDLHIYWVPWKTLSCTECRKHYFNFSISVLDLLDVVSLISTVKLCVQLYNHQTPIWESWTWVTMTCWI